MKKLLLLGIILSLSTKSVCAGTATSQMDVHRKGHPSISETVHRMPAMLPCINMIYDSDARTIEISCMQNYDATVWFYDAFGNVVGFSDSLNTIFNIPQTETEVYNIRVESEEWYAEGTVELD